MFSGRQLQKHKEGRVVSARGMAGDSCMHDVENELLQRHMSGSDAVSQCSQQISEL